MGFAKVIDGAKGKLEGRVVWRGSPMSIDYPTLNGRMALNLERGQFLPVDPGLAKLAGVLSLQGCCISRPTCAAPPGAARRSRA